MTMPKFKVETGNYQETVHAENAKAAVVKAFKKRAPKTVGMLAQVTPARGRVVYLDAPHCLSLAGYDVP